VKHRAEREREREWVLTCRRVVGSIWPIGSSYPLLIGGSSYSSSSLLLVNLDLMRMAVLIDSSFKSDRSSIYVFREGLMGSFAIVFTVI
jgi:hypothetical protein